MGIKWNPALSKTSVELKVGISMAQLFIFLISLCRFFFFHGFCGLFLGILFTVLAFAHNAAPFGETSSIDVIISG